MSSLFFPELRAKYELIIVILLTLIGFGIRLNYLNGDSLWPDELITIQSAQTISRAFQGARDHPPLLYVLTSLSINEFGENEFSARLPSVFAGSMAIPAIFALGKLVGGSGAGLWSVLLLAFSPLHLRVSQLSRHYAWLMLFSLISYVFIYRALSKPKWRDWVMFAAVTTLNLYTHFGGLLVFATQSVLIAGWSIVQIGRGKIVPLRYALVGCALAVFLFLPWVPRLVGALEFNVGSETLSETGSVVPLTTWVQEAYLSFGMYSELVASILVGFALLGLIYWLFNRAWLEFSLILCGLILPLGMIQLFQIARGALARYIIYMLPIFLVAASYGIHQTLMRIKNRAGSIAFSLSSVLIFGLFLIVAVPSVGGMYRRVYQDWRGMAHYIQIHSDEKIIVVTAELNNSNRLDRAAERLPYYLDEAGLDYTLLPAGALTSEIIGSISKLEAPVWLVIADEKAPPNFSDSAIRVSEFQTNHYIVHEPEETRNSLGKIIAYYEAFIPRADSPKPKCLFQRDLALLSMATDDLDSAQTWINDALLQCPDLDHWTYLGIFEALLNQSRAENRYSDAQALAKYLIVYDPKNEAALEVLTYINLLVMLEEGNVQIEAGDSPEPVETRRFIMPDNGDWGDVLFLHPPAKTIFEITLPEEPVIFSSRVALAPESWSWGGDGVTFVLSLKDESGEVHELFRQHVSNDLRDRDWHEVKIPLSAYAGQKVILTLATEVGPAGDGTGDWAGWETPRLMWLLPDQNPGS